MENAMAKKKRRYVSPLQNIHQRAVDTEAVAAMLGTRGRQYGRANITLREARFIKNRRPGSRLSATDRQLIQRLYAKTKKAQDERAAARRRNPEAFDADMRRKKAEAARMARRARISSGGRR